MFTRRFQLCNCSQKKLSCSSKCLSTGAFPLQAARNLLVKMLSHMSRLHKSWWTPFEERWGKNRWDQHTHSMQKLKRIYWNNFERPIIQHLHFPTQLGWTLTEISGRIAWAIPFLPPHQTLPFSVSLWLVFYSPPTSIPAQSQVTSRFQPLEWRRPVFCTVFCPRRAAKQSASFIFTLGSSWKLFIKFNNKKEKFSLQFLNIMKNCVLSCVRSQTQRVTIFDWICSWCVQFGMSLHVTLGISFLLDIQFPLFPFSPCISQLTAPVHPGIVVSLA